MIKFGVAGNSNSFYDVGFSHTYEAAKWCAGRGIDAFEYSFGRGVRMRTETAKEIGDAFKLHNVDLSVHAPYYVNFANSDPKMIDNSIGYIISSMEKVDLMGGKRVVFHPGAQGKHERAAAVHLTIDNLKRLRDTVYEAGYNHLLACAETMGKVGQIGTVDEIISFCNIDDIFIPCVDFGHVNAREQGLLSSSKDFEDLVKKLLDNLPSHKVKNMHVHFSKIEYGKSGEIRHLTFEDKVFGPNFEDLVESLHKYALTPVIICESDGTQAEDAVEMKRLYFSYYNKK